MSQGAEYRRGRHVVSATHLRLVFVTTFRRNVFDEEMLCQQETIKLGRLAAALGAVPSSASRLCDRLEAAGLVRRSHCEEDKRELTLSLTPSGRSLVEELQQRRRADLARVLSEMPPAGRIALLRGLQAFAGAADSIMERQAEEPEDDWTRIAARLLA
ncbi:MarR family transcriptional regulator [Nonomuraea helvata]|uniref:MarR family transcriptional regulator n=1 Tax=Nonomuraea helvata TaxID=37484 RepID=A0ABV5SE63_9ACTN